MQGDPYALPLPVVCASKRYFYGCAPTWAEILMLRWALARRPLLSEPAPPGAGYLPPAEDGDRRTSLGFQTREPPAVLRS